KNVVMFYERSWNGSVPSTEIFKLLFGGGPIDINNQHPYNIMGSLTGPLIANCLAPYPMPHRLLTRRNVRHRVFTLNDVRRLDIEAQHSVKPRIIGIYRLMNVSWFGVSCIQEMDNRPYLTVGDKWTNYDQKHQLDMGSEAPSSSTNGGWCGDIILSRVSSSTDPLADTTSY
ncbi:hypothetical protein L9F63_012802, partial [Diploptera punctata]